MRLPRLLPLLALLALTACATPPQDASRAAAPPDAIPAVSQRTAPGVSQDTAAADRRTIAELTQAIRALGDGVDPAEAARAAHVAVTHSRQLARDYGVTDPPLVHNAKVHLGLRPRGLCFEWADDLEARLAQENFRTLTLHRAISPGRPFRIEHSTVIIARTGDSLFDGQILDPWRDGGTLYWGPTRADRFDWRPRAEVLATR
jgi:hypothetical protein